MTLTNVDLYLPPFWNVSLVYLYVVTHLHKFVLHLPQVWGTWNLSNFLMQSRVGGVFLHHLRTPGAYVAHGWEHPTSRMNSAAVPCQGHFLSSVHHTPDHPCYNRDYIMDAPCLCRTYGDLEHIASLWIDIYLVLTEPQALCPMLSMLHHLIPASLLEWTHHYFPSL